MALTAEQLLQLRRMVAEPLTTTYTDLTLTSYVEKYPIADSYGYFPNDVIDTLVTPNVNWTPTYDFNAAAADVWDEKAGALAAKYDFSVDGGNYSVSKAFEQAVSRAKYYRARRSPTTATLRKYPYEYLDQNDYSWIGNLPELGV